MAHPGPNAHSKSKEKFDELLKIYDVKSASKKWSASPDFCINSGLIVYPQMLSLLKMSLDTLDMYVCSIFYALNRLLINNSHGKCQEYKDY